MPRLYAESILIRSVENQPKTHEKSYYINSSRPGTPTDSRERTNNSDSPRMQYSERSDDDFARTCLPRWTRSITSTASSRTRSNFGTHSNIDTRNIHARCCYRNSHASFAAASYGGS